MPHLAFTVSLDFRFRLFRHEYFFASLLDKRFWNMFEMRGPLIVISHFIIKKKTFCLRIRDLDMLGYGGLDLVSSQFLLMRQLPQKILFTSKLSEVTQK